MESRHRAVHKRGLLGAAAVLFSACSIAQTQPNSTPSSSPGVQTATVAGGRFTVIYSADAVAFARRGQRDLTHIVRSSLEHVDSLLPGPRATFVIHVCTAPITETGTCELTVANGSVSEVGFAATSSLTLQQTLDIWLPRALAHEVNHQVRAQSFPGQATLLDGLAQEGTADVFDNEAFPGQPNPWDVAITPGQEHRLWAQAKTELNSPGLYQEWMFGDRPMGIPVWAGFTIGYHIVVGYLALHPTKSATNLAALAANTILAESNYDP